eukprot:CAMPEP_0172471214 /NCGR_PEP_ID=MMETSP1065-20121228/67704_1 /TAXON_ID=265537 /ORGANISM="Amphiprora paludosa, Strain CCMP125" /LENGTH=542 /DNA_ID=CAMNT_0013229309 /DNA_START=192 /DNA_END=1820 /DNA_ORIENTATION=-
MAITLAMSVSSQQGSNNNHQPHPQAAAQPQQQQQGLDGSWTSSNPANGNKRRLIMDETLFFPDTGNATSIPVAASLIQELEALPLFSNQGHSKRLRGAGGPLDVNSEDGGLSSSSSLTGDEGTEEEASSSNAEPMKMVVLSQLGLIQPLATDRNHHLLQQQQVAFKDSSLPAPHVSSSLQDLKQPASSPQDPEQDPNSGGPASTQSSISSRLFKSGAVAAAAVAAATSSPPQSAAPTTTLVVASAVTSSSSPVASSSPRPTQPALSVDAALGDGRFRNYQEGQWKERFAELINFQNKMGHSNVPHNYKKNPPLARWVKRQRYQYRLMKEGQPSTMTDARIQMLEDIGFIWDCFGDVWEQKLTELKEYKARFSNCDVPCNYQENPQLATWVKCQRRQFKLHMDGRPSSMSTERIQTLESLGFRWGLRSSKKRKAQQERAAAEAAAAAAARQTAPMPSRAPTARLLPTAAMTLQQAIQAQQQLQLQAQQLFLQAQQQQHQGLSGMSGVAPLSQPGLSSFAAAPTSNASHHEEEFLEETLNFEAL